jgi:hypothetical protein
MSSHLVFPHVVSESNLVSATSQGGATPLAAIAADGNVGGISVAPSGSTGAVINDQIVLTADGNLGEATYKASNDGGTTDFGRQPVTLWNDGAGGAENTCVTILDDTDVCGHSRVVLVDTDGDGVLDRALIAISRKSNTDLEIYYTDDLLGGTGWAKLSTVFIVTANEATTYNGVQMVARGNELFLAFSTWVATNDVYVYKSLDFGATFTPCSIPVNGVAIASANIDMIVLASSKILLSYIKYDGANFQVYCISTADGVTWTATPKQITTAATDKTYHAMVQDSAGKTICFYMVFSSGILARQCTNADSAKGSASWATYSETLPGADASNLGIAACIGADGTKHIVVEDSTAQKLFYSGLHGTGTFSALDTIADPANDLHLPRLAQIGGALWLTYYEATTNKVQLAISQCWVAYSAGNEAPTPLANTPVLLPSGIWATFSGSGGLAGDTWNIDSEYLYGAHRAFLGVPRRPFRSASDNAATFYAVFDMGANGLAIADTVLVQSNLYSETVEFDSTDTFTPDATCTVSHVCQTIAAASLTLAGCQAAINGGTLTPHAYKGYRARFATSGEVFLITDNTADRIWCQAQDIDGGTGDLQILAPRAWNTLTQAAYRYMRISIPQQQTYENYYSILVLLGIRTALDSRHVAAGGITTVPVTDSFTPGGALIRVVRGPARRSWALSLVKMATAEYAELAAQVTNQGAAPFAFIKDSANKFDWGLVQTAPQTVWAARQTALIMDEVV